ncbi:MAG: hypothetical protein HYR91_04925 [Flavobacteriia bacterium]|nr:hypothetical protein [Flavobacteriia bacterium]
MKKYLNIFIIISNLSFAQDSTINRSFISVSAGATFDDNLVFAISYGYYFKKHFGIEFFVNNFRSKAGYSSENFGIFFSKKEYVYDELSSYSMLASIGSKTNGNVNISLKIGPSYNSYIYNDNFKYEQISNSNSIGHYTQNHIYFWGMILKSDLSLALSDVIALNVSVFEDINPKIYFGGILLGLNWGIVKERPVSKKTIKLKLGE